MYDRKNYSEFKIVENVNRKNISLVSNPENSHMKKETEYVDNLARQCPEVKQYI